MSIQNIDGHFNTGLAQLVEHWSPKPGVVSSSLATRARVVMVYKVGFKKKQLVRGPESLGYAKFSISRFSSLRNSNFGVDSSFKKLNYC